MNKAIRKDSTPETEPVVAPIPEPETEPANLPTPEPEVSPSAPAPVPDPMPEIVAVKANVCNLCKYPPRHDAIGNRICPTAHDRCPNI